MTREKALEVLTHHNDWRRGRVEEPRFTATEIGVAIDVALEALSSKKAKA